MDEKVVNCTTLINPTNATIVFDVGWQAIPETIVFNLILFAVSVNSTLLVYTNHHHHHHLHHR